MGILVRRPKAYLPAKPVTEGMADLMELGRARRFMFSAFQGIAICVIVVYGWPCAEGDPLRYERMSHLVHTVLGEAAAARAGPTMIVGDFNCFAPDLPALRLARQAGAWHDLVELCGQGDQLLGTCLAPSSKEWRRRDFAFGNSDILSRVASARVIQTTHLPVHRPLRVTLQKPSLPRTIAVPRTPASLAELVCNAPDPALVKRAARECMDRAFALHSPSLRAHLQVGDTSAFWMLWCSIVEDAVLDAAGPPRAQAAAHRGHGSLKVTRAPLDSPLAPTEDGLAGSEVAVRSVRARRVAKQARRLRTH